VHNGSVLGQRSGRLLLKPDGTWFTHGGGGGEGKTGEWSG